MDLTTFNIEFDIKSNQSYNLVAEISSDNKKLSFNGAGKVTIKAVFNEIILDSFEAEVIYDAVNVSQANQFLSNKSYCLIDDIILTGSITIGKDLALYGNNHTLTATTATFNHHNANLVTLNSGIIENVNIIGVEVDNFYTSSGAGEDYFKTVSTLFVNGTKSIISNCHIKNGKYTVRFDAFSGEAIIRDTIIESGAISLGVTRPSNLVTLNLENIKVVQLPSQSFIGAGILLESAEKVKLNFSGEENTLQNFVTYNAIQQFPSDYQSALTTLWNDSSTAKYKFSYDEEIYMHVGILGLFDKEVSEVIPSFSSECNLNGKMSSFIKTVTVASVTQSGILYAFDNSLANDYVSLNISDWINNIPLREFNYYEIEPVIKINNDKLIMEHESSSSIDCKELITNNINARKYGKNLDIQILIEKTSGNATFDSDYIFTGIGTFKIYYTIIDIFNIDSIGNPTTYIYECDLNITIKAEAPKINIGKMQNFDNSIPNPDNLDLSGLNNVIFIKEAEKTKPILETDPIYALNAKEFFEITITDYLGNIIDETNIKMYVKTSKNESYTEPASSYNSNEYEFPMSRENKPNGNDDKQKRYVRVYYIKIVAQDRDGRTAEKELALAFYVPKLSLVNWW